MTNRLRLKLLSACRSVIESFAGSIKKKLFVVMVLLTCLPLIALSAVAIHNARSQLEAEITTSNLSKIEWSGSFLDDQLQVLDQILFSLMNDQTVTRFMETDLQADDPVDFATQNGLFERLSAQYLSNSKSVGEIMLYKRDIGKVYSVRNGEERILPDQQASAPWNALAGRKPEYAFVPDSGEFTMYRPIYRFIDRKLMGGVALRVHWSLFDSIFRSLAGGDGSAVLVAGADGRIVHEPFGGVPGTASPGAPLAEVRARPDVRFFRSGAYYVFAQPTADANMTLVKLISTRVVSESSRNTLWFSLWTVSVLIGVCIAVSIFIANRAAAPILKLVRAITWTEETNGDWYIGHNRKDEIGLLEQKYARIIQSRYQIYIEKRTAQLKALQAQMDPHFLHNTLQSIGAMAVVKDVPDIYRIIQAISGNLRYTTNIAGNLVTLNQEYEHVRNYLLIQQFRFKDKIAVEWDVDPAAAACLIPPLTLQPIVENSFEHGFRGKKSRWLIRIRARLEPDKLRLEIEDNGVGLTRQTELELQRRLSRDIEEIIRTTDSMALSNIQARFKTQFGSEYGLALGSAPDGGVRVALALPILFAQGGEADDEAGDEAGGGRR